MRLLILLALVGSSVAAPQVFGARNDFDLQSSLGSYLPPDPEPTNGCPTQIFTETKIRYTTVVSYSTVYQPQVEYLTTTRYSTQVVPTTFYSQIIRSEVVPSVSYVTKYDVQTVYNTRTSYVNIPGATSYITVTQTSDRVSLQVQTRYSTSFVQVPTTVYRESVSTVVVPRPVISTVYRTQVISSTNYVPGPVRYTTSVQYSTVLSTQVIPGQIVYRTSTAYETRYKTTSIYARPSTQVVTSTQVKQVYTTLYSNSVVYRTQTQVQTQTQYDTRYTTVYSTQTVPQVTTRTVSVPQIITRTVTSVNVVPTVYYSTAYKVSTIRGPGATNYITVTSTAYATRQEPGVTRTDYVTRTSYNTNIVYSTKYDTSYNTITVTQKQKQPCKTGYDYSPPAVKFNF